MPGATILGCAGPVLTPDERAFFADADPWGFIVFDRNLTAPDQIRALTASLRDCVGRDAPVLIDQEGGRVQRLRPPLARDWPPPFDHAARAGDAAGTLMRLRYALIGAELRALGIDVNCVPTADVVQGDTHPFLANRCYGTDADRVATIARAVADGCLDAGILPVVKHMPGHGRGRVDSHLGLPLVDAGLAELRGSDFAPFRALRDLPLGMSAHVVYRALDDRPATVSPVILRLVREEIGFDGLLMTDDLSMGALGGPVAQRAQQAIDAGCDVILHCNGDLSEMASVAGAAGALSPAATTRAARALARRKPDAAIDIAALDRRVREIERRQ